MTYVPYTPTPLTQAVVNPAIGGLGVPYPYVSNSEYIYAPTAMDINNLVVNGIAGDQAQSLANTLRRASGWADRICFGADPAGKGASLCATSNVETATVRLVNGGLRLVCDYKPIIAVTGLDVGPDMTSLSSIQSNTAVAGRVRIGRRTIYVPNCQYWLGRGGQSVVTPPRGTLSGWLTAVWSYVNGYPHTELAAPITAGTSTCSLAPTDGGTGLLGMVTGATQLRISDGALTETFLVQSVSGTTVTSATPFQFSHAVPPKPDFVPVTTLPADVGLAVIFLATALIKTEGDLSVVLEELSEPRHIQKAAGDIRQDVTDAMCLLRPFRVRVKAKN